MDMQPKVLFIIHQTMAEPLIKEAELIEGKVVDSGIEVNEYAMVQIKLECEIDSNAFIRIEPYNQNDVVEIREQDGETKIMGGSQAVDMLVPGPYYFEVYANGKKYAAYYQVLSKDFSSEALTHLRMQVESMRKGLSYEYTKEKFGMPAPFLDVNPNMQQIIYFMRMQKKYIQHNLLAIMKDPLTTIEGTYKVTAHSKKSNAKSVHWLATKGEGRVGVSQRSRYYEKQTQLSLDIVENQWIAYIVKQMIMFVRKLSFGLQKEIVNIANQLDQQRLQLASIQTQKVISNPVGYEKALERIRREEYRVVEQIRVLNRKHKKRLGQQLLLKQYRVLFRQVENTSWVQALSTKKPSFITSRLHQDARYKQMYQLYRDLVELEKKQQMTKVSGVQFRKTWQLFEFFNVGLVIRILQELGYEWTDGWKESDDTPLYSSNILPSNTALRFSKPNSHYYIEVVYDGEVESMIQERHYSRYFNLIGRRPDIRITIYYNDGRLFSDKAGIVIESKCRRHLYLINNHIDPDVKIQLRDFKNMEFFDAHAFERNEEPVKMPIKQVIVTYPKQTGMDSVVSDYVYGDGIIYLQLEPNDPTSEVPPFGYEALKQRLEIFFSQIKE